MFRFPWHTSCTLNKNGVRRTIQATFSNSEKEILTAFSLALNLRRTQEK
jgi:hypothetical protein